MAAEDHRWLIDALEGTWAQIVSRLEPCPESDFDRPTRLPGWSVRDIVSHLTGFELLVAGVAAPEVDVSGREHVKNAIGALNERFVEQRRGLPGHTVLDEFAAVASEALTRLMRLTEDDWNRVGWSPEGDVPYHRFMETRLLDSWIHLEDIADALGPHDDDEGPGAHVVLNRFEAAMPYVVGKRAQVLDGESFAINLTGPLGRRVVVVVDGGRARAVTGLAGGATGELTTPTSLFWRRCAGRISANELLEDPASVVEGDHELVERVVSAMVIMI